MLRKLLFLLLVLLQYYASAQTFYVSGYVRDEESGEPLSGVFIEEPVAKLKTNTNSDGYYILPLPAGNRVLNFTHPRYIDGTDSFYLGQSLQHDKDLVIAFQSEEEGAEYVSDKQLNQVYPGEITIDAEKLQYIPVFLSEYDFIKNLQLLPGVNTGLDGSNGLHVRGSGPDQNMLLLDGMPVYNTNHYYGFFSGLNNEMIKSFDFYKGPSPARFGSRLSSVLNVQTKDGNMYEAHGNMGISMLSAFGFVEAPILEGTTSMIFSARRTLPGLIDLFNPLVSGVANEISSAYFYDINFKLTHKLNAKDKLQFSVFTNRDRYYAELTDNYVNGQDNIRDIARDEINWTNLNASARYTKVLSKKAFVNILAGYSRNRTNFISSFSREVNGGAGVKADYRYKSSLEDIVLKADFEYWKSREQRIHYGIWQTGHMFRTGDLNATQTGANAFDTSLGNTQMVYANEMAAYVEDEINIGSYMVLNLGLRVSSFVSSDAAFVFPEPRISTLFKTTDNGSLKLAYSWNTQYIQQLNNPGISLPTYMWVPSSNGLRPSHAHQFNASYVTRINDDGWEFVTDAYYNRLNNVLTNAAGTDPSDLNFNYESRVTQGRGDAYGLEFMLQKKYGRFSGWVSYTLARSTRQMDDVNNGERYDYRYDRRHSISTSLIYKTDGAYVFAINVVYGTGYAYDFPYGVYLDINGNLVNDYGKKNSLRLSDYFRIDASIINKRYNAMGGTQELVFSAYNLTNHFNAAYAEVGSSASGITAQEVSFLGFIPSFTYKFTF
ncbi:MAG: hypothetical protein EP332_14045 [Bacteroidetes bacterium]|nr:MAG: hypothetical protein EP332_14045 [Bacteroidota bacterium]